MRLSQGYEEWMRHNGERLAASTRLDYESCWKAYLKDVGHWKLHKIQRGQVLELLETVSQGRKRRIKSLLCLILDFHNVNHNLRSIRIPGKSMGVHRVPSRSDVLALAEASGHYKSFILTAAFSGLRLGEIVPLLAEDISEGVIDVNKAWCWVSKRVKEPKSKTSRRRVVVLPEGIEHLPTHSEGLAFLTPRGRQIAADNFNHQYWNPAKAETGLEWRFHDLRHHYATSLIAAGVPLPELAAMMGHANPNITMQIYAGLLGDPVETVKHRLGGI